MRTPSLATGLLALATASLAAPSFGLRPSRFGDIARQVTGLDGGAHTATTWDFIDCGLPTDAIEITSLEVSPDPPEAGKQLVINASGTVKQTIDEGAYADVVVKLGLIKILTKRFDVCEELRSANATLQCPVKPGDYDIVQTVDLPAEIPRAKFLVQARAFTQAPTAPMACADIIINFMQ